MADIYDMVDTWNAGATTFTAIKMNVTDTASAAGSSLLDLQVGGVSRFAVSKTGLTTIGGGGNSIPQLTFTPNSGIVTSLGSANSGSGLVVFAGATPMMTFASAGPTLGASNPIQWTNAGGNPLTTTDVALVRDGAAGCLAQRNSTNPQAFRVYNTFTDASNYERGFFRYASNALEIGHEGLGTGAVTPRTVSLWANGTRYFTVGGDTGAWNINNSNNLVCGIDNTRDIGASGANRPRNLYMASWIRMATTVVASLPAAATAGAGARMFVTDALTPVFGSAVTGGGAVTVPVYSTGSAWNVG